MTLNPAHLLASIPSPDQGVWDLGPIPIRAYALIILVGVVVGAVIGDRRWVARGGRKGEIYDLALWAVPFGIVGARVYHVLTDWTTYFGDDGAGLMAALKIWQGGLGIWGAVAGGTLGAWIAAKRHGILLPPVVDAVAPGIAVAQAIGRWGNWANQELFGRPTDLPWALEISAANRPEGYEQFATFHPTFLYESLWCLVVAGLVVWADKRFTLGHGRAFALYVFLYSAGRVGIEAVRIDNATLVAGLRINIWTASIIALLALAYVIIVGRRLPGRERSVYRNGAGAAPTARPASDEDEVVERGAEAADADSAHDTGGDTRAGPGASHRPESTPP